MKKIIIPNSVSLVDINGKTMINESGDPFVITFNSFVTNTLLIDVKFGKTMTDILNAVSIKTKLTLANDILELEDEEWNKLNDVAKEPSNAYNPSVVMQLTTFLIAIKDAK